MLTRTRRNDVRTATPGTWPLPSPLFVTSRSARIATTKVATNKPIAVWLGLSCRIRCTIRRRELPHRKLHHNHRDRQHQRRQAYHRGRNGCKNRLGCIGTTHHAPRDRLISTGAVNRDCPERNENSRKHTENRDKP